MHLSDRVHTYGQDLLRRHGERVHKIALDAGFTCPNRDGTKGIGGCSFCNNVSFSPAADTRQALASQIATAKRAIFRRTRATKFIAYFQAYSNTYGPVERLQALYHEALSVPGVVGLIIATRPDCLPDPVLDLLARLREETYLWLELGLQSIHDKSLTFINRRHDYACFVDALKRAKVRRIRVCAHVILGLPGESREEMLAMAGELSRLGVDGVKLHLLHVMKGTRLAEMYERGEIAVLDRDGYAGLVCDFLGLLDPDILIHRLTGDGGRDNLVAPLWSLNKFEVLNLIDAEMERRNSRQGIRFFPERSAPER